MFEFPRRLIESISPPPRPRRLLRKLYIKFVFNSIVTYFEAWACFNVYYIFGLIFVICRFARQSCFQFYFVIKFKAYLNIEWSWLINCKCEFELKSQPTTFMFRVYGTMFFFCKKIVQLQIMSRHFVGACVLLHLLFLNWIITCFY